MDDYKKHLRLVVIELRNYEGRIILFSKLVIYF